MIKILLLFILTNLSLIALSQDTMEKVMDKRAREMHRVLGLSDKEQWKKFIKENYTQQLIDKPMRAKVQTSDDGNTTTTSSETKAADNLEAKAMLFERLHNDFGNSEIVSIKPTGEKLEMIVKSDTGMTGTFHFTFDKKSPYLVDGLGIEANN